MRVRKKYAHLIKKNGGNIIKRRRILNQIGVIFVTCLLILLYSQIVNAATYYIDYNVANGSAVAKVCLREYTHDYLNSAPSAVYASEMTWADSSTNKPYIHVTYH